MAARTDEFGHVLFRPFGRFIETLGGSLFQVMMLLGVLVTLAALPWGA